MTHKTFLLAATGCVLAIPLRSQQSDTTAAHDSTMHGSAAAPAAVALPTLGAIADLLIDASPNGSTLASERRFELREIQMAIGAGIDRHVRGDIVLSLDDAQQLSVMEASLSTVGLPWRLHAKAGRFHLPFGKQNTTHRAELPTIEYPLVIRRFLGTQGGMGTGLWLSKAFGVLGFQQELQLTAIEQFPDDHGHDVDETHHAGLEGRPASPANRTLEGLGYTARLRNSWWVRGASQIELAMSAGTGKRAHPFGCDLVPGHPVACPAARGETAVNARQSLLAADVTLRFRSGPESPEWLLLQSEVMRLHNEQPPLPFGAPGNARYLGPVDEATGAYVFARGRLLPRLFVGTRLDWMDAPVAVADANAAASAYLQFALSDLTRITAAYERVRREEREDLDRLLVQAVIAIGAHRSH